jgi:hypothetical protein
VRGMRRTVLGVLATAVTAAGVLAPTAASAATTAIHWENQFGSSLLAGETVSVCTQTFSDYFEQGRTVEIQVLLGGVWTTKQQTVADGADSCVDMTPSALVPGPGTYSFRAQFQPAPAAAVLQATASFKLVTQPTHTTATDEYDLFTLTTTLGRNLDVDVSPAQGQMVELQRKVGGVWSTIAKKTAATGGTFTHLAFAVPNRAGNTPYRVVARSTKWTTQTIGSTYTGHQTDVAKHQKYLIAARAAMKRFCPATPIYVNTTAFVPGDNLAGLHTPTIDFPGDDTYRFRSRIELRSGYDATFLKHLALHECAHAVQARTWIEGHYWGDLVPKADKLFPGTGLEGQADCMAWVITHSTSSMYYVSRCSTLQQANARKVWLDWGYKYQGASYTWTDPTGSVGSLGEDGDVPPPPPAAFPVPSWSAR